MTNFMMVAYLQNVKPYSLNLNLNLILNLNVFTNLVFSTTKLRQLSCRSVKKYCNFVPCRQNLLMRYELRIEQRIAMESLTYFCLRRLI